MLRKAVCALFVMTVSFGIIVAEEFNCSITKVEGKNVTFQKYKPREKGTKGLPEKDGDPMTLPAAADVKVTKGKFNKDDKKFEAGDPIEGGLTNEMFTKISEKGVNARITTSDDKKTITQILTIQFGGKKKAAN